MKKLTTRDIVERLKLEVISGEAGLDREITTEELSRPALQLAGYFSHYSPQRIQILGTSELSFFKLIADAEKKSRTRMLCTRITPCIIISTNHDVPEELIAASNEYDTPVLRSTQETTKLMGNITNYIQKEFAPTTSVHGVFIEVYGIGVLITGESGIGKSEIALELIKRGHRLVADDRVDIKEIERGLLIGSCESTLIKHLLEIRGLGIINVMTLFGTGAVRSDKRLQLNVHLETWNDNKQYDRIGLGNEYKEILNSKIEKKTIPVRPGRNVAIIIETAAMNYRLNQMGINTAEDFTERLAEEIKKNNMKSEEE